MLRKIFGACLLSSLLYQPGLHAATVPVDCGAAGSINSALASNTDDAALLIQVSGNCIEEVVITRPGVTIEGVNANAQIKGNKFGIIVGAEAGAAVIRNIYLRSNSGPVVTCAASAVVLDRVTIRFGQFGVISSHGGSCNLHKAVVENASILGISVGPGSSVSLGSTAVRNNQQGILVLANGTLVSSSALGFTSPSKIFDNVENGVTLLPHGVFRSTNSEVFNNGGNGIFMFTDALFDSGGSTIIDNNDGSGIHAQSLATLFFGFGSALTIENNGVFGVNCDHWDTNILVNSEPTIAGNGSGEVNNCDAP